MGAAPTKLMVRALTQAAMTFPVGVGLGWDGIHPRAICRLSEAMLEWLANDIYQWGVASGCRQRHYCTAVQV